MDSPLVDLEAKLLSDSCGEWFAPSLYLRYVDDVFGAFRLGCSHEQFRLGSSHEQFFDKLNHLHPNLKFTSEVGPSVLPYSCILEHYYFTPYNGRWRLCFQSI